MSTSSSFPSLLARSKFATYDPLISRVYTAPSSSSKRGDWGFKYTLPPSTSARPRPRYLKLEALVGEVKGGSYRSGEKEARFIERWGDGRVGWLNAVEAPKKKDGQQQFQGRRVTRGEMSGQPISNDLKASGFIAEDEAAAAAAQEKLQVPDIETMSESQFEAYLEQVRANAARKGPTAATPLSQTMAELENYESKRIVERPHRLGGLAYAKPAGSITREHSPLTILPGRILQENDSKANRDKRVKSGGVGAKTQGFVAGIGGLTAETKSSSIAPIDFSRNSPDKGSALFRIKQATLAQIPSVVKDSRLRGTGSGKVKLAQDYSSRIQGGRESAIKATSPLDEMQVELNVEVADQHKARQALGAAGARSLGDKEWVGAQRARRNNNASSNSSASDSFYKSSSSSRPARLDNASTSITLQNILANLNGPGPKFAGGGNGAGESTSNKRAYHSSARLSADSKPTASPSIDPKGSSPLTGPGVGAPKPTEGDGLAGGEWRELEENVAGEVRHDEKLPGQLEKQEEKQQ